MEYREEPGKKEEEYSFMQETIKDENGGYKKVRNLIFKCAGRGLVFGLAACLGFFALKPWAQEQFGNNPKPVTIPVEEEPEEKEKEKEKQPAVLTVDAYREMNRALVGVGNEVNKSMAEISAAENKKELEDTAYDEKEGVAGVILVDNGTELLILGSYMETEEGAALQAELPDGGSYAAKVKGTDRNLGLSVYALAKNTIPDSAWAKIKTAAMGSSAGVTKGDAVIAVGKPFGYWGGMGFGVIASAANRVEKDDGEYKLLCTDIAGAENGTGVLANTNGDIIGIIDQSIASEDSGNLVTAYGISDIKTAIQFLFNGESIPYIGIRGVTVTDEISKEQNMPKGVYVQEVQADSPAMAAGIQSGDVLTEVGKTEITSMSSYHTALMNQNAGDKVKIKGKRQGTGGYVDITFTVEIGSSH